jgi:DNA-binding MarR family transcriptional regulator
MTPIYMKKEEKRIKLNDFSDYISEGIKEAGNDMNLNVEVTQITKFRQGKMPQSVIYIQDFAYQLAKNESYSLATFRVLNYLISLTKYENFISIDVKTISDELKLSEASVKRATKQLSNDNIIHKMQHPTDKRRIDYFFNPQALWKGKTIIRDKYINSAKNNRIQLELFPNVLPINYHYDENFKSL